MAQSDTFTYKTFNIQSDRTTVDFGYELTHDGTTVKLKETLQFPFALADSAATLRTLKALHIGLGISYYKTFLPPVILHGYAMDQPEADFWNSVFVNGLGEFLYVNKLPAEKIARFTAQDGLEFTGDEAIKLNAKKAILGIGGGKDSVVAGETLKKLGVEIEGFVMATGDQLGQAQAVSDVMGISLHAAQRTLDKQLLQLQEQPGAYKGHVPISLIFGLVGTVAALTSLTGNVVVANEVSASIPGVIWDGKAVNHQWSKSFEFEQALQAYIQKNIAADLTYFSAIRPLTSVAVARKFVNYPQYFEVFTSDNFIFRIDPSRRPSARWSLESPKSLSSFILLAPWLEEVDMLKIFGRDFLDEADLKPMFLELVGLQGHPPLDCVGTVDELVLSLNLLVMQGKFTYSQLIKFAHERGVIKADQWDEKLADMLKLAPEQAFPPAMAADLMRELSK